MRTASLAVVAATGLLLAAGAAAKSTKSEEHLDYRRTYADALLEARIRNLPVFVSRHKDG